MHMIGAFATLHDFLWVLIYLTLSWRTKSNHFHQLVTERNIPKNNKNKKCIKLSADSCLSHLFWFKPFCEISPHEHVFVFCERNNHQTLALQPTTHCPILFPASFPFTGPFVWVSVSGVVCRQASIVSNHCSLLTQGPRCFMFPWPPSPRRTEGWNRSPGAGEEFVCTPLSLSLSPGAPVHRAGWLRGASVCLLLGDV